MGRPPSLGPPGKKALPDEEEAQIEYEEQLTAASDAVVNLIQVGKFGQAGQAGRTLTLITLGEGVRRICLILWDQNPLAAALFFMPGADGQCLRA